MKSQFHRNVYLNETANGKGLFASQDFNSREPIFEMTGNFFSKDNLPEDKKYVIQIGKNLWLGPSGDFDDFINHSCNPNCYLEIAGNRAIVYSLYFIKKDSELVIDYSLGCTDTVEDWNMSCNCKSYNCRKSVSGFQYLPADRKEFYERIKVVPYYQSNYYPIK